MVLRDGGGELCDRLTKSNSRIKVVHQSNAGLSAARNHGLKVMRGKFVTFIDSDDTMQPEMINYLYHAIITTANRQTHSKPKYLSVRSIVFILMVVVIIFFPSTSNLFHSPNSIGLI